MKWFTNTRKIKNILCLLVKDFYFYPVNYVIICTIMTLYNCVKHFLQFWLWQSFEYDSVYHWRSITVYQLICDCVSEPLWISSNNLEETQWVTATHMTPAYLVIHCGESSSTPPPPDNNLCISPRLEMRLCCFRNFSLEHIWKRIDNDLDF